MVVAETYAEVIGVLSQSHFVPIEKSFFLQLNELRKEATPTPATVQHIIALLMGMKFFRIKVEAGRFDASSWL